MNRFGSFVARESSRFQTTDDAEGSFPLSEMKSRPVPVAAQSVPVLLGARSIAATKQPVVAAGSWHARSPQNALPRSEFAPPMRTKSPQAGLLDAVVNSGQFASR